MIFESNFSNSWFDFSSILKENILNYLSYNLQISYCFSVLYDTEFLNKKVNLKDILLYCFNEMKPFNFFIKYTNQEELRLLLNEFLAFIKEFYNLNFNEKKVYEIVLKNIQNNKNTPIDIFSLQIFETNKKFYKHLYFHQDNSELIKMINSNIKTSFTEWKSLYNDSYENSKINHFEKILSIKPFFEKNSFEYDFYNNKYKKCSTFKNFDIQLIEIQKSNEFIRYSLNLNK